MILKHEFKRAVIVDLDGTLALNQHRLHFIDASNGAKPDWGGFFLACDKDEPNKPVIEVVQSLKDSGFKIHIFSARGKIAYQTTLNWLKKHTIPYDALTLRETGDYRPDEDLKAFWLKYYYPDFKDQVLLVIDDRQKVVNMWRSHGLVCLQVAHGDF